MHVSEVITVHDVSIDFMGHWDKNYEQKVDEG